jgi:hypothetical protein
MVKYVPDQGDIVWLDFKPQKSNEIKKTRPALVISCKKYNTKTSLAIFMPITSKIKHYPFEIEVKSMVKLLLYYVIKYVRLIGKNEKLLKLLHSVRSH